MSWDKRHELTKENGFTEDGDYVVQTGEAEYKFSENGTEWLQVPITIVSEGPCYGESDYLKWFYTSEKAKKFLYRDMKALNPVILDEATEEKAIEEFRLQISNRQILISQWTSQQGKAFISIRTGNNSHGQPSVITEKPQQQSVLNSDTPAVSVEVF